MFTKLENSPVLGTKNPSLEKILVGSTPVKEGKNLPNSVTEDICGISIMPNYSAKQLRRIERRQKNKITSLVSSSKRKWEMTLRW